MVRRMRPAFGNELKSAGLIKTTGVSDLRLTAKVGDAKWSNAKGCRMRYRSLDWPMSKGADGNEHPHPTLQLIMEVAL